MGSGSGGNYASLGYKSQSYASSYSVVDFEYNKDIKNKFVYSKRQRLH